MSTTSRKSAVKPGLVIAIGLIVMAMAFAAFAFKGSLITYMGFQQAMNAGGDTTVQIIGAPVKDATRYDQAANTLDFTLRETATGATMPVVFKKSQAGQLRRSRPNHGAGPLQSSVAGFRGEQSFGEVPVQVCRAEAARR